MMNNNNNNSISNAKSSSTKLINTANTDTNMVNNNSQSGGANIPSISRSSSTDSSLSLDEAVMLEQKKVEKERLEQMAKRRRAVLNGKFNLKILKLRK